jgi:hypothetical protein
MGDKIRDRTATLARVAGRRASATGPALLTPVSGDRVLDRPEPLDLDADDVPG